MVALLFTFTAFYDFSILVEHAVISVEGDEATISPAGQHAKTKVNGIPLTNTRPLTHMDRILFGTTPLSPLHFTTNFLLPILYKSHYMVVVKLEYNGYGYMGGYIGHIFGPDCQIALKNDHL